MPWPNKMSLRPLRLFLVFAALGWGVTVVGVFASWPQVNNIAQGMGAKPIAYDPMLDYWLRMISGAFALIGLWYLALAIWPGKFAVAIPWFGADAIGGRHSAGAWSATGAWAISILRRCLRQPARRHGDFIFCASGKRLGVITHSCGMRGATSSVNQSKTRLKRLAFGRASGKMCVRLPR